MKRIAPALLIIYGIYFSITVRSQEPVYPSVIGDHLAYFEESYLSNVEYINDIISEGNEIVDNSNVTPDSLGLIKTRVLTDLRTETSYNLLGLEELESQIQSSRKEIEKYGPYMPYAGKILINIYNESSVYIQKMKTEYELLSQYIDEAIDPNFGVNQIALRNIVVNDINLLKELKIFSHKYLNNFELEELTFQIENKDLCKRESKFLKKNKIEILEQTYNEQGYSDLTVKHTKTGKIGFVSIDPRFENDSVFWFFRATYDSIDFDHYQVEGINRWTTAIGWSENSAFVVQKDFLYPDYFGSEYKIIKYESKYYDIWFPEGSKGVVGQCSILNEDETYSIIDLQNDSLLTIEYNRKMFLPRIVLGKLDFDPKTILNSGEIKYGYGHSERNDIDYRFVYSKDSERVTYIVQGNTERWYRDDGSLSAVSIKPSDTLSILEQYYPSGRKRSIVHFRHHYENGELVESEIIVDTLKHENRAIESIGYRRAQEKGGPFETFYSNGQLHERGSFRDTSDEFFTKFFKDGPYESYYFNGQLKSKGIYYLEWSNNKWLYYDPFGNLMDRNGRSAKTELVFPTTFYNVNKEVSILPNRFTGLALVNGAFAGKEHTLSSYSAHYSDLEEICEIWDTKSGRQFDSFCEKQKN